MQPAILDDDRANSSASTTAMNKIVTSFGDRLSTASHVISPSSNLHEPHHGQPHAAPTPSVTASGEKTLFYLAYGSNLAAATFQGARGIKPLRAINVAVPSLRLTFDLAGLPYTEPCFANTALRSPPSKPPKLSTMTEMTPILSPSVDDAQPNKKDPYHKNRWTKPLVGVVYEITPTDYAHVIATEGGGSAYQDIEVPCFQLSSDPSTPVPNDPEADGVPQFLAHTLFAPSHDSRSTHPSRPDPSYAQPSTRYLGLITSGAAEHGLPDEYKEYLGQIRSYTITSVAQRLGQFIFTMIWGPVVMAMFALRPFFQDKHGHSAKWFARFSSAIFTAMWRSYDGLFFSLFGDGERTIYKTGDDRRRRTGAHLDLEKAVGLQDKGADEHL